MGARERPPGPPLVSTRAAVQGRTGDSRSLSHTPIPRVRRVRDGSDRESLFAAERSQGPGFRWTSRWASSHTELWRSWNFGWKGSLIGGLPEVSRPTGWSRRSTRTSLRRSAESSMEARTNEYASDRRERGPPRPPLPRGSGFTGGAAQSPRSADNVAGCRSATSAGRSPTQGFPAACGTGGSGRVLRDRRRPGIVGSLASGRVTRLGRMNNSA